MKTGLFGQQLTLMEELKASTYSAHARLQELPFFQALAACQLPLESYVGQLRALAVIHGILEEALGRCPNKAVASVWKTEMSKQDLLREDLRFFEPRVVADIKEAAEAAQGIADHVRLRSLERPLSLLGCAYVLEGSTLGAVVLRPQFARAFLLTGDDGVRYLRGYGPEAHVKWAAYQRRMNDLRLDSEERAQIVESASDFFARLEALFRSLYPFKPESRTFLVTSINPEAGRHPFPADGREVSASLQAADICWKRYPYFAFRYGERGLRFARSDAAWLATLSQWTPPQISQQVKWLGRLLYQRGMPTLLLEAQLEILVEELSAQVPEKRAVHEKLLPAANELGDARRRHFDEARMQALAGEFNQAVGAEWSGRYRNAGELLISAVADAMEGEEGGLENIKNWMTDASRFPAAWIKAVEQLLTRARHADTPRQQGGDDFVLSGSRSL